MGSLFFRDMSSIGNDKHMIYTCLGVARGGPDTRILKNNLGGTSLRFETTGWIFNREKEYIPSSRIHEIMLDSVNNPLLPLVIFVNLYSFKSIIIELIRCSFVGSSH